MFGAGTVGTVVVALAATLLGGGLATARSELLDGNTWIVSVAGSVERLLRINPSGQPDIDDGLPAKADDITVHQQNAGTVLVNDRTGEMWSWDQTAARWQRSRTSLDERTALHLTGSTAFVVDRANGGVKQLRMPLLSEQVGPRLALPGRVSDSTVDGKGVLWVAQPDGHRVTAIRSDENRGPSIVREYTSFSAGDVSLTALPDGVLASDPQAGAAYRLVPSRAGVENVGEVPRDIAAASTSDDGTGAVYDRATRTVRRVGATGWQVSGAMPEERARHTLGRPVVFAGQVYVADETGGVLLRAGEDGFQQFPEQQKATPGQRLDVFVDDGRLWANARAGAEAFSIDRDGAVTTTQKFKPSKAPRPTDVPDEPSGPSSGPRPGPTGPGTNDRTGTPGPGRTGNQGTPTRSAPSTSEPPRDPVITRFDVEAGVDTVTVALRVDWRGSRAGRCTVEVDGGGSVTGSCTELTVRDVEPGADHTIRLLVTSADGRTAEVEKQIRTDRDTWRIEVGGIRLPIAREPSAPARDCPGLCSGDVVEWLNVSDAVFSETDRSVTTKLTIDCQREGEPYSATWQVQEGDIGYREATWWGHVVAGTDDDVGWVPLALSKEAGWRPDVPVSNPAPGGDGHLDDAPRATRGSSEPVPCT